MVARIPINNIRSNVGWEECNSCAYQDSSTCDFCEEADQWEEMDLASLVEHAELLAA